LLLLGAGEGGVEVIEVERFEIFTASQNGVLQLAADITGQQARVGMPELSLSRMDRDTTR